MSQFNMLRTLLFLLLPAALSAQVDTSVHHVKLEKRPANERHEFFSPVPLAPVSDSYQLLITPGQPKKTVSLVAPQAETSAEKAIMELFFTGGDDSRTVLILACDYQSTNARYYVDKNQNFDFSDDGSPILRDREGALSITLKNNESPKGKALIKLEPITIPNQKVRENWKRNIKRKPKFANTTVTEPDLWFRSLRFNTLSADVEADGLQFQIGLHDLNLNGLYNDPEDRILIGEFGSDLMITDLNSNNYEVGDQSPFAVGNKGFQIKSIDKNGTYIEFYPIDFSKVPSKLKIGDPFPTVSVKGLEQEDLSLDKFIVPGKYNYLEFWGTWCRGCVEELPKIREAATNYEDKLNIVGLHYGRISNEKLQAFVKKHNMHWQQLLATQESVETFKVSGYPYGILIDPKGKISAFHIRIDEVLKQLN